MISFDFQIVADDEKLSPDLVNVSTWYLFPVPETTVIPFSFSCREVVLFFDNTIFLFFVVYTTRPLIVPTQVFPYLSIVILNIMDELKLLSRENMCLK